jgi:hypothetical protein
MQNSSRPSQEHRFVERKKTKSKLYKAKRPRPEEARDLRSERGTHIAQTLNSMEERNRGEDEQNRGAPRSPLSRTSELREISTASKAGHPSLFLLLGSKQAG